MNAARCVAVVVSCSLLAGCGALNTFDQAVARASSAAPRPNPDVPAAPDLRIPADAVASTNDIPLVPVPPVPIGRGAAPQTSTAPPRTPSVVTPASASTSPAVRPPPSAADSAHQGAASLRQLQQQAAAWYAGVDSYTARLTRREVVNGTAKPEEILLFRFRKEPWSVYFKWLGPAGRGREVIYVKGQYENKIHTRLAAGDAPLMPAGTKMALAVDSLLVRSASRHSITEAGIGAGIDRIGALLDAQEHGNKSRGVLTDLGLQKRPEYDQPVRGAELVIPAGVEPELPNGGRRQFFFDPEYHLPLLLVTHDDKNQEVEYYHFDRLLAPGHLDAADFDPDKLWTNPKPAAKAQ